LAAALDVVGRIQEEAGHQTPSGQLAIHGSLELFVAGIWDWMNPKGDRSADVHSTDARLLRVLESLNSQLRGGPLPFETWKRETGLSRVQLERIAKKQLGVSLRAHRDERLLSEIRRSLASGRESLKETAARLGFFDAPHFNRWVRIHTGRSPRELQGAWD
jgi:AraC-like DNA-binding protein